MVLSRTPSRGISHFILPVPHSFPLHYQTPGSACMHGLRRLNLNLPVVQQQQQQQASRFSANIECKQVDITSTRRWHEPER